MATVQKFEDLRVWKTARQLTSAVYRLSDSGPFGKDFGLKGQIQRAAVSVMSNIAEGFGSRTQSLFVDLLGRARGSAAEVQSQLYVAHDLGYIEESEFDDVYDLADKASRQLYRLIQHLESQPNASRIQENRITYDIDLDES